jgi:lambda repressor-like predicted transcriptional regulator
MDEVLNWLFILPPEERKLVWARACEVSWRQLEDHDGRSSVTLRKIYNQSLMKIANVISGDEETIIPKEVPPSRFQVHHFKTNDIKSNYFSNNRLIKIPIHDF